MAAPIQTAASHSSKHLREHASCDTSSPERVLSNLQKTSLDHGNLRAVRSLSAHSKRRDLASPTDNFYCGYQKWRRRVGRSQGVSQDYSWRETPPLGGGGQSEQYQQERKIQERKIKDWK
jgi:hypothetical protein